MFYPQAGLGEPVDYPDPRPGEMLPAFARRIEVSADVYAGVSMGGMVALELARIRPCRGVVLIASCRSARMAPTFASTILKLAPRLGKAKLPAWDVFVSRLGSVSENDRRLLVDMLHDQPIDRLREFARMICDWKGVADPGVPVVHVHGSEDLVIPIRFVKPDVVVRGGGHALNLSHAAEVNAVVRRFVSSCASGAA